MAVRFPIVVRPEALRSACDAARGRGARVAFVPTMGALHEGHLSLVREARARADFVVVSIFVNPTQFGPNEDFARYPRDLDADAKLLDGVGVDLLFAPPRDAMYPVGDETRVAVPRLAAGLCGPFRPGHFEGVATVVAKLLSLVGAADAIFGRKDYQQLAVIRRLVVDLYLPTTVVGAAIVREADGVAMSSRNAYLTPPERERARALSRGLAAAAELFAADERSIGALVARVRREVEPAADRIDYVDLTDADSLAPLSGTVPERALLAIACHIGKTRLIDNTVLGEDPPPITSAQH